MQVMRPLLFVISVATTLILSADTASSLISTPLGWEILDKSLLPPDIQFMARSKPKDMFSSTINVATEETDLSLDAYMAEVEKIHIDPTKTFSKLGTLQTKAGLMRVIQIDEKLPWADLRILQGILIRDHIAYVVTATTEEAEFPLLVSAFLESMKSFSPPLAEGAKKP